jgi:hypothetical protein
MWALWTNQGRKELREEKIFLESANYLFLKSHKELPNAHITAQLQAMQSEQQYVTISQLQTHSRPMPP